MHNLITNAMYKHYKGGLYHVQDVARHTETSEMMVVYRSMDGQLWVRPLKMFLEKVEVDGKKVKRFVEIIPATQEGA